MGNDITEPHPDKPIFRSGPLAWRPMPRRDAPHPFALRIGQRLRALREERGLTMEKLAYESDLGSKGHISSLERGLMVPTVETIRVISERLEVLPLDLLCFPDRSAREELVDLTRGMNEAQLVELVRTLRSSSTESE